MLHHGSSNPSNHVIELDGLRGILAIWVVVSHVLCWCGLLEAISPHHDLLEYFWRQFIYATPAVESFMILSGFAISFLLHSRSISYPTFIIGRFFRIYPVYFVCLVLGILSSSLVPSLLATVPWRGSIYFVPLQLNYVAERHHMVAQILSHLTLLNGLLPRQLLPNSASTFLPPAWSITLEWQYYLVAPLLAFMVRSGVGILFLVFVSVVGNYYGDPWHNSLFGFLPGQLPLFLVGIGSYHLYAWFTSNATGRMNRFAVPVATVLALAMATNPAHSIALSIWALVFGSVFVQGEDLLSRILGLIRGFLLHRSSQWLGKISYSLYLIHWPLLLGLLWMLLHIRPSLCSGTAVLILATVGIPSVVAAAALLNRYVELPGMAFGKKLLRHKNGVAAPSTNSA